MSADYAVPTSWEDLLADEKQRRLAQEFLANGGVTSGAEDRAPYAWEMDGTRRPGQASGAAPNFTGVDLVHQSTPTAVQDRFQSLAHALKSIPADTLANFAAGTDANMRRVLGEPVAQVMPLAHSGVKTPAAKATASGKPQKSTDPASPESKRAQGLVKELLGDNISDEALATMSEADAENILKYGTAKAQRGLQARGQEITETANKNTNARVIERTKQDDVHFWAKMQQEAEQFGVSDATRRYIAEQALKAAQAARDEAAATKEKDKADAVNVPGYEPAPNASPTPKDAETLKTISQANKELEKSVGALRDLHRRFGPSYAGAAGTQTKQIMTAIKLAAKTIADLGALSGPDQGLMDALAGGDPSTIEAVAKSTFGVDNTAAAMDGLMQWAQRRIAAAAEARGYRPKAATPQRTTPDKVLPKDAAGNLTLDPPPAGKVRVIINGKPMLFPAQQLDAVKKRAKERGDTIEVQGG